MVAERETLLEFTVRVVAEPETLAEITAGWSKMVTKPRKCIGLLNRPPKTTTCRKPTKTPTPKNSIRQQGRIRQRLPKDCSCGGWHSNKGARHNAVTIPMGGRRA